MDNGINARRLAMKKLHILFDASCEFCWRCRGWLQEQPAFLELEFIPSKSAEAARRFPGVLENNPARGPSCSLKSADDLVVVSDEGGVYRGPDAFIMCLYALQEYREYSAWLTRPLLRPLARQMFEMLSKNRWIINQWFYAGGEAHLAEKLQKRDAMAEFLSTPEWLRPAAKRNT
jgi:predicted DCC family thiol-disulfide oxidoreductase YuxK